MDKIYIFFYKKVKLSNALAIKFRRTLKSYINIYNIYVQCLQILRSQPQVRELRTRRARKSQCFTLSKSNNNQNPNNKTTKTVVGMRLSNRWEPLPPSTTHHHHTNSKLHDRVEIEQNSENKSYQSILGDPKTVFEPHPNPKNTPLEPLKAKNDPKIKSKSKVKI